MATEGPVDMGARDFPTRQVRLSKLFIRSDARLAVICHDMCWSFLDLLSGDRPDHWCPSLRSGPVQIATREV